MSKYSQVIYPSDDKNEYPFKLSKYIYDRFIAECAQNSNKPKLLDIGCSTGRALNNFNKCGNLELFGIDRREERVADNITFKICDIETEKLPFPDDTFDVVYSKSVLEHVHNTTNFISEAHRVLKPGGMFVCLTPDWKSQQSFFWDDFTHVKPFTRKGLRDALRILGFETAECEYFYQLPFLWKYPALIYLVRLVSLLPDRWKWKDKEQRNTRDRKLIRFSKEKMLLSYGRKPC